MSKRWLLPVVLACLGPVLAGAAVAAETVRLRLVTGELPPYAFHVPPPTVAEAGEPMGLVYELVRETARRIGNPTTVEFFPWSYAQNLAQKEPNIGILAVTRTPEREDRYSWIFNVVTDDLVLVGGTGVDASSLDRLKDRPIGVLQRSGAEALLRGQGFTRVQPATEEWINAQKMRDRLLDAWLAPRLMVLHAWREIGGDVGDLAIGQVVRRSEIWLAGSKELPEAEIERWRQGFASVQADGTYDRVLARYTRLRPEPVPEASRRVEIEWAQ